MLIGTQGSGKTTTAFKLAYNLKTQNKKVLLVAADTYRPGAVDQLKTLGKQIDTDVFTDESDDPLEICKNALIEAESKSFDVIIYDTAGYPSIFYNYGKNFYVKDYEELKNKFNLWKENPEGFRENLINETHKYFAAKKSPKKIYEILHEYLEKEFDYYI